MVEEMSPFSRRKKPLFWVKGEDEEPPTRVVTEEVCDMVEDLCNSREELAQNERVETLRDFLETEVGFVVEATEMPFYTDADETIVYNEIRARAVEIKDAIFTLMNGRDIDTMRRLMPQWRWNLYADILDKARLLSRVRGVSEEVEED